MTTTTDHDGGLAVQPRPPLTMQDLFLQDSGAQSTPESVTCGDDWMVVLGCGLKLSTGCAGSGAS